MDNNKTTPLLETVGLKKYFKVGKTSWLHAVDNINLRVDRGKTLGVVGESGCGKTTLGRTVIRLLEPNAGDILFNGKSIVNYSKKQMKEMRKELQIIFQDPYSSINPRMTVAALIAEYMIVNKTYKTSTEIYNRVAYLMDMVGLARRVANSYPHELDGGRRQRIGVARALSLRPKFIVCDEPVSALDVSIQAQILNLLMDLQEDMELTYMFITHDLSVVKHISTEIMVMYLGQCVELASSDELFANPLHPYTKALLAAIPEPNISTRSRDMTIIRGELTSPINPDPGCRFGVRCDYVTEACLSEEPELRDVGNSHFVACPYFLGQG